MKATKQKEPIIEPKGPNPVVVALTGAMIGAGAFAVGAAALSNQHKRQEVKTKLTDIKNQALDSIGDFQDQAMVKKNELDIRLLQGKVKAKKVTDSVKKTLRNGIKDAQKAAQEN